MKISLILILVLLCPTVFSKSITIGAKKFTEANVMAYVLAHTLKSIDSSLDIKVLENLGGTGIVTTATENQEIDLYVDYTGTLKETFKTTDETLPGELLKHNLKFGFELGFNNSYGMAVKHHSTLSKMSDIKNHHRLGISHEFLKRKDGFSGLASHYGFNIKPLVIEYSLLQHSLKSDKLDIIEIFTTDAKIIKYNLKVLKDDQHFYKRYDALVVFNKTFYEQNKQLVSDLSSKLFLKISDKQIQKLNHLVDIEGLNYEESARSFTKSNTHIKSSYESTIWPHFYEHLEYLFLTIIICIFIGVPLGVTTAKSQLFERVILSLISITQTIPSLALLVFLIPLFGLGKTTTLIALCLYGLLPIVKSTHMGIKKIPKELSEYSKLIGMSFFQRIFKIEIPLALIDIVSGVKLTAIYTIGVTVIAAFVGAGGLGTLIVTGLSLNNTDIILQGALPSAGLAIIVEIIFQKVIPYFMKDRGLL